MNLTEANRLLAYVSLVDGRRVDDTTVVAWQGIVGDLDLEDCLEAVRRHFAKSKDWLMPAHVRELVMLIRDARRPKHETLALPSRFEVDEERIARVKRGIAECAEALSATNGQRSTLSRTQITAQRRRSKAGAGTHPPRLSGTVGANAQTRPVMPRQSVATCSRCRGFYIDDEDGRRAHRVVFGHGPTREDS